MVKHEETINNCRNYGYYNYWKEFLETSDELKITKIVKYFKELKEHRTTSYEARISVGEIENMEEFFIAYNENNGKESNMKEQCRDY